MINLKIANEYREIHDLNKDFDFNEGFISPTSIFRQSGRSSRPSINFLEIQVSGPEVKLSKSDFSHLVYVYKSAHFKEYV